MKTDLVGEPANDARSLFPSIRLGEAFPKATNLVDIVTGDVGVNADRGGRWAQEDSWLFGGGSGCDELNANRPSEATGPIAMDTSPNGLGSRITQPGAIISDGDNKHGPVSDAGLSNAFIVCSTRGVFSTWI